jgi:hypothetical protein
VQSMTGRRLTTNRVKLAWFIADKFDRKAGHFAYGLETITKAHSAA